MNSVPSIEEQIRGRELMQHAHELTAFREDTSPIIGVALAVTDSTYLTTGAILYEVYTDYKDGEEARRGAALLGTETSVEGALNDPAADKTLANSLMLGHMVRFLRQRNPLGAAILAANYIASKQRDAKMKDNRELAVEYGLDPKAIPINKVKFAAQMAGNLLLSSPFSRKKLIRRVGFSALTGGTLVGMVGERLFRNRVRKAIAEKEFALAANCPDTLSASCP